MRKPHFLLASLSLCFAACSGNEIVGIHISLQKEGPATVITRALVESTQASPIEVVATGATWTKRASIVHSRGEVQKLEDTRKKYRDQLMSAKTNEIYKTLLHEIETSGHAISARETIVLEALEAADLAAAGLAAAKKELAAAEGRLGEERRKLEVDLEVHEAKRREARTLADSLEAAVPLQMLSHYRRIREGRDGRGMALAVGHEHVSPSCG